MKTLPRFCNSTAWALILSAIGFAQHYTQTNLVSNMSGVAPVADPQLINRWGLSRGSGNPWWVSDQSTGLSRLYNGVHHLMDSANVALGHLTPLDLIALRIS